MFTPSDLMYHPVIPIIDAEVAAEIVRQRLIADLVTPLVGTLFSDEGAAGSGVPPGLDVSSVRTVLDVGCGQGEWALELAYMHPELEVAGIDAVRGLIDTANRRACDQMLTNASFGLVDFTCPPFDLSEESCDLVTATFLRCRLEAAQWPPLLQECHRLLQPGGLLRLVECELGQSSSPALEQLSEHYRQAIKRAGLHPILPGHAFEPNARSVLRAMLSDAGLPVCAESRVTLDFSASQAQNYAAMRQVIAAFVELVRPFVLRMGTVSEAEYARLVEQARWEIGSPLFCGRWHLFILWAGKERKA
jgi:SAM-dependent methyltransferase